jgi:LmbE family N-acetylglucosaminyl deacetylase
MSILFIGAHPDDIELGCGGTICHFVEKKPEREIICYHTTNGVYSDINGQSVRDFEEILEASNKSLSYLGIKKRNIIFADVPATQLKVNKESISELQKIIINQNVQYIFTHNNPDTYHQDHRNTHFISMAAARRYVNNIFLFELYFNYAGGLMIPNSYIDISKYMDKKCESVRYHKTEYIKFGSEKWIEDIKSLSRYRGMQVNVNFAEAFHVMKSLLII